MKRGFQFNVVLHYWHCIFGGEKVWKNYVFEVIGQLIPSTSKVRSVSIWNTHMKQHNQSYISKCIYIYMYVHIHIISFKKCSHVFNVGCINFNLIFSEFSGNLIWVIKAVTTIMTHSVNSSFVSSFLAKFFFFCKKTKTFRSSMSIDLASLIIPSPSTKIIYIYV